MKKPEIQLIQEKKNENDFWIIKMHLPSITQGIHLTFFFAAKTVTAHAINLIIIINNWKYFN